jgi:hypothetical protein
MSVNIAFGPVTLPADFTREFGPYTVKQQDNTVLLTVSRTVPNGLDATPDAVIDIAINQSTDGVNWILLVGGRLVGDILTWTDRQGVTHQYTESTLSTGLDLARAQLKATVASGGVPVAVAGTFVVN